eukprot:TRINITY_DN42452_c0_g1_i1.p1 TRINITY_DN42452_c0_g1~~TRINITY_DN42452_c0_g1_i1.p1  ORF type:complete len:213 (-),score=32.29 TRINITY_DN42452_c0_g1_i1:113-751(-)
MAMSSSSCLLFKYIIIGDVNAGKSCLLLRFTEQRFEVLHNSTIGYEFASKHVEINQVPVKLHIWDTAGQESFQSITRSYYRGAVGVFLVYDVSSRTSFVNTTQWLTEARHSAVPGAIIMLVGNKCDMERRQVPSEEGSNFARSHGLLFLETSAKTAQNVDRAFMTIGEAVYQSVQNGVIELSDEGLKVKKQGSQYPACIEESTHVQNLRCCG